MSATPYSSLAPVAESGSAQLRDAIRQLVDAKYEVDELACHGVMGRRLTEPFHDGAYGPRVPTSFFQTVLPFSGFEPCGKAFNALVPISQTIGASWRWTTRSVPEGERSALLAKLQDPERANVPGRERAEFMWIKPLGLFLAHEGKNRVGFFRDMDVHWIPAHVVPYDYPAASRFAIYAVEHAHQTVYWAVLDDILLEPINHPDWALPVLRAYGVPPQRQWPNDFPTVDVINAAIADRLGNPASIRPPLLDLNVIREKQARDLEEIRCSLFDLHLRTILWQFLAAMTCVSIGAVMLLRVLPDQWLNPRIATAIVAGIGMGGVLTPFCKLLRLPRWFVDLCGNAGKSLPQEHEASNRGGIQ